MALTALGLCIILPPLAFGSVHRWAMAWLQLLVLAAGVCWCARRLLGGETNGFAHAAGSRSASLVAFALAGWLLLSVIPFPPLLLSAVSPATGKLLRESLPGWPDGPGYQIVGAVGGASGLAAWRPAALAPSMACSELTLLLSYVVAFLVVTWYPWRDADRCMNRLAALVVAIGIFEAAYVMVQAATRSELIFGYRKPPGAGFPSGTYVNRNHAAGLLEMALPLAGAFALEAGWSLRRLWHGMGGPAPLYRRVQRVADVVGSPAATRLVLQVGICVLLFFGIYQTLSRSGLLLPLASALLLAPLLIRGGGQHRRGSWGAVLAVVGFVLALTSMSLPELSSRFSEGQVSESASGRGVLMRDSLRIVGDFPVLGVGLGSFGSVFPAYRSGASGELQHLHNDYLELAIEAGVPALLLAGTLIVGFYRRALLGFRRANHPSYIGWGALVAVTALLLHSVVDFNLHIPANALIFSVLVGIVVRLSGRTAGRAAAFAPGWPGDRVQAAVLLSLLLLVAWFRVPVARAEIEFHRLYPDWTLIDTRHPEGPPALEPEPTLAALHKLARQAPGQPLIEYRLAQLLAVKGQRQAESGGDAAAVFSEALRHYAAAARGMPQWAEPHLEIAVVALSGVTPLTRAEAEAALERARRLDPYDRDLARDVLRARQLLVGARPS